MTPEEQYNALVVERDVASDNITNINNQMSQISNVLKSYVNATPEQQDRVKPYLQQVIDKYNSLKEQRAQEEDRWSIAQNTLNHYQQAVQPQQVTTVSNRSRNYVSPNTNTVVTPEPEVVETPAREPITVTSVSQLPANIQRIQNVNNWMPWTLSQGQGTTFWEYAGNVWQWITENVSPTTWVYQNNSRAPGYNVWRTIGNAVIPVTTAVWAWLSPSTFWVGEGAVDSAKNALFQSNVNKVTNIPSQPYTTNPSNIQIKWTSPNNLPQYYTAPSKAPTVNVLRSNPSNISITPTSLTRFRIPNNPVSLY